MKGRTDERKNSNNKTLNYIEDILWNFIRTTKSSFFFFWLKRISLMMLEVV